LYVFATNLTIRNGNIIYLKMMVEAQREPWLLLLQTQ